ncbi:hypothetical protein AKG95_28880 (plasmid) [Janthinobacterium lividum]|uniref:Uncharacterized protein n=1 Tax=Janthinobacterium lividum TaxID=29581 RepID=A0A1S1U3N3_9BURK|nr:hypothetical protein AKG95_28880 [Janthinobacterium lividum]
MASWKPAWFQCYSDARFFNFFTGIDPFFYPFRLAAAATPLQRRIGRMAVFDSNCLLHLRRSTISDKVFERYAYSLCNFQNLRASIVDVFLFLYLQLLLDLILQFAKFGNREIFKIHMSFS